MHTTFHLGPITNLLLDAHSSHVGPDALVQQWPKWSPLSCSGCDFFEKIFVLCKNFGLTFPYSCLKERVRKNTVALLESTKHTVVPAHCTRVINDLVCRRTVHVHQLAWCAGAPCTCTTFTSVRQRTVHVHHLHHTLCTVHITSSALVCWRTDHTLVQRTTLVCCCTKVAGGEHTKHAMLE